MKAIAVVNKHGDVVELWCGSDAQYEAAGHDAAAEAMAVALASDDAWSKLAPYSIRRYDGPVRLLDMPDGSTVLEIGEVDRG